MHWHGLLFLRPSRKDAKVVLFEVRHRFGFPSLHAVHAMQASPRASDPDMPATCYVLVRMRNSDA